jgi:hypothetical protein
VCYFRDDGMEMVELTENNVNPGQKKTGPQDFELQDVNNFNNI